MSEFDWGKARKSEGEFNWSSAKKIDENTPSMMESLLSGLNTGAGLTGLGQAQMANRPNFGSFSAAMSETGLEDLPGFNINAGYSPERRAEIGQTIQGMAEPLRAEQARHFEANPFTTIISSGVGGTLPLGPLGFAVPEINLAKNATIFAKAAQAAKQGFMPSVGQGALFAGTQYTAPDESRLLNTVEGAGIGGLVGPIAHGGGAIVSHGLGKAGQAVPGFIRGRISDEELAQNLASAEGTKTSLGRIVNNPTLTQLQENILKLIPFSGASKASMQTGEEIEKRAVQNLMDLSGGRLGFDEDIPELLQKSIQQSARGIRDTSEANYKAISDLATDLGVEVDTSNVKETAQRLLSRLTRTPLLEESLRKHRPDLLAHLENLASAEILPKRPAYSPEQMLINHELEKLGMPGPKYLERPESIESLGLMRAQEGEKAWNALLKGERNTSAQHTQLKKAYQSDIDDAIANSGSTELIELGEKANEYYKNVVSKLEDPKVAQFINDPNLTKSEKIIGTFIKFGPKDDRVKLLKQLTDHLDEPAMQRLRNVIFSGVGEESDVTAMIKNYSKLGPKQKAELIPEVSMRENMDSLVTLAKMNPKVFTEMFNPETGQKNTLLNVLSKVWDVAKPAIGIGAATINPTSAIALAGTARLANNLLTSEKVRNKLVNAMLNGTPEKTQSALSKVIRNEAKRQAVVAGTKQNRKEEK